MSIKPNPAMLGLLSWSGSMQMYAADHRWANAEIKERYRLFADGCFGDLTDAEWEQNCLTINAAEEGFLGGILIGRYLLSNKQKVNIRTLRYGIKNESDEAKAAQTVLFFPPEP